MFKRIFLPLLTLAVCVSIIYKWTHGFTAYTVYSYALQEAGPTPRDLPKISLLDHNGEDFILENTGKYHLINFVYLNCPSVCHKVNNQLEQIYHLIPQNLFADKLEFVTISFDMKNDNVEKINNYRKYFGTDIDNWTFALPYNTSNNEFQNTLREVGVWMNKDNQSSIINHSINFFLVSPNNEIVHIFDPARQSNEKIKEGIEQCLIEQHTAYLH